MSDVAFPFRSSRVEFRIAPDQIRQECEICRGLSTEIKGWNLKAEWQAQLRHPLPGGGHPIGVKRQATACHRGRRPARHRQRQAASASALWVVGGWRTSGPQASRPAHPMAACSPAWVGPSAVREPDPPATSIPLAPPDNAFSIRTDLDTSLDGRHERATCGTPLPSASYTSASGRWSAPDPSSSWPTTPNPGAGGATSVPVVHRAC